MKPVNFRITPEVWRRGALVLGCLAALLYFFSPSFGAFALWSRVPELGEMLEVRRGVSVLYQTTHLGAPIPDGLHAAIQWRLLFPLLGGWLGLPPVALFGLAPVGVVIVLGYLVALLRRSGAGWGRVAGLVLCLGAADWCFVSTGWLGYYDAWLVLGLLVVAFACERWPVWLACVWAPWVDERFVLGLPVALLCRELYLRRAGGAGGAAAGMNWRKDSLVPAGLVAVFAVVRLWVLPGTAAGATAGGYWANLHLAGTPWVVGLWGAWEGLRLGWLLLGAGLVLVARRASMPALILGAVVAATVLAGLATAQDFSRSMMLVLPAAVLGAVLLVEASPVWLARALGLATVAALVLPAHHVINDRVNPIYYLYHELAVLRSPPPEALPETYELRAIRAMQAGDLAAAEQALNLAIKLAQNPASAAKQRGVLHAGQQRWAEARADFNLTVQHEPDDPDGWFFRAQAEAALGDLAEARSDMEQALAIAPRGWGERPDVARFRQRLGQR